jgi:nitrate/nitrite-specific signal transduction histidine kinase
VAVVVLASAVLGHAIARTILDPLRLLVQGAEKIQDGEYGHVIDLTGTEDAPTEFKQLVRAFNRCPPPCSRTWRPLRPPPARTS